MRRGGFVVASAAAIAIAAACTDLGGLSGSDVDAGAPVDSGAPSDAAPPDDGSTSPDAADASGCARYPDAAFCNDFEGADPLGPGAWSAQFSQGAANPRFELLSDAAVSPTHAARVSITSDAGACQGVALRHDMAGTFGHVTVRAAVQLTTPHIFLLFESRSAQPVFHVAAGFNSPTYTYIFYQKTENGVTTDVPGAPAPMTLPTSALGRWLDVSLDVDVAANKIIYRIGDVFTQGTLPAGFTLEDPQVLVGPWCLDRPESILVDDVVITSP